MGISGSGKSLFAVKKALYYHNKGIDVYSNISLTFPFKLIKYEDIINCRYSNCAVFIDEAHLLLNSRRSMTAVNIEITSSFISQIRKQGLEVYLTTQKCGDEERLQYNIDMLCRRLDINLRSQCDFIYFCERWTYINRAWIRLKHNKYLDKSIPILIKIKVLDVETEEVHELTPILANDIYDLYDSREIIKIKIPKKVVDAIGEYSD